MNAIEVECPECSRRLRLAAGDRGKSIRCPVCRCIFSVRSAGTNAAPSPPPPPPAARASKKAGRSANAARPEKRSAPKSARRRPVRKEKREDPWEALPDENLFDDDFDAYADVEESWEEPTRKRRRRKTSSRPDIMKVALLLLMSMVGVGAVGGIGYAIYQFLPTGGFNVFGNAVNLAYMPRQIEAFVWVDVDSVLNAPVVQPILNANPDFRRSLIGPQAGSDFRPEDIDSLTFGIWKKGSGALVADRGDPNPFGMNNADTEFLMVMRTNRAIGEENFGMSSTDDHQGTTFFNNGGHAVWVADSYTAVFGSREAVVAAIDQGATQHQFTEFDFVDSGYDVIFAGAGVANKLAPISAPSQSLHKLQTTLRKSARGVALGVDFSSRIDANVQVHCSDSAQATALADEMRTSIFDGQKEVSQSRGNPMVLPFLAHIDSVLNSVSVTQSGDVVRMRASVEKSTVDAITQLTSAFR